MKFPCTQCGACCKLASFAPKDLFPQNWILPDGSCKNLTARNTCSIYQTRPDVCNIEKTAKKLNMNQVTKDEFFHDNAKLCNVFMENLGIQHLKIDLTMIKKNRK